ncbi:MAG: HobA family DNA replication regulator [Campylobacter sp.]|nr:HobA family DNA replication regulator [Campylobacter sp.]
MQDLFKWSLEEIRKDPLMAWLEVRREDLIPLLASRVKFLLDGKSFLVFCDDERSWFESYVVKNINKNGNERPLLPFYPLRLIYPRLTSINTVEEMELLNDMLSLSFPNGFVYFYIGRGNYSLSQIAKNKDDSFMWLIDENTPNSFSVDGKDDTLDVKLLNLFRLFDRSISAVLFDQVMV